MVSQPSVNGVGPEQVGAPATPLPGGVDQPRVKAAVLELLAAIGEDTEREGLLGTPRRIAEMYGEIFAGLYLEPRDYLNVLFEEGHDEMVILKDIPFYSLCEHHFMPFHGVAHVGYIPEGKVVGISKIARVVEGFAKRPQVQERLTCQIADCIMEALIPDGVAVVVEAEHLCMTMRGVKKPGSRMITSAMRGHFKKRAVTRSEFLALVQGR
ncbi:MAG: GTP cyclohydrolase I FolE [Dehalococcoidia bacterium]